MDVSSGVVIWRIRRGPSFVSCLVEQLGEECFELRIFDGQALIHSESFEETEPLLERADTLQKKYTPEKPPTTEATKPHVKV